MTWPTPVAKANADAECPDGRDLDVGMATWRTSGTSFISRSGLRRRATGLTAALTTAEATATDATPVQAARRPAGPPAAARTAALRRLSRERSAARESRRIARSSAGVGVRATAA